MAIDLKRGADAEKLMQKLFKMTKLEDDFKCNFNILVGGVPQTMGIKQILEEWWNEFVDVNTMRDQLSLPYVVWKLGYQYTDVGILGNNIYGDERMTICSHR